MSSMEITFKYAEKKGAIFIDYMKALQYPTERLYKRSKEVYINIIKS